MLFTLPKFVLAYSSGTQYCIFATSGISSRILSFDAAKTLISEPLFEIEYPYTISKFPSGIMVLIVICTMLSISESLIFAPSNGIFSVKKYEFDSTATAFRRSSPNAFHISANLLLDPIPEAIVLLFVRLVNMKIFTKFARLKRYMCKDKFWLKLGCRYV